MSTCQAIYIKPQVFSFSLGKHAKHLKGDVYGYKWSPHECRNALLSRQSTHYETDPPKNFERLNVILMNAA